MALTPQEMDKLKGLISKQPTGSIQAPEQGLSTRVWSDIASRGNKIGEAIDKGVTGQQNPLSSTLQVVGNIAGGVLDVPGELVGSGLKATGLDKPVGNVVSAVANTEPVKRVTDFYNSLSPEAQGNLDSIANIASLIGGGAIGKKVITKGAIDSVKSVGTGALEMAKNPLKGSKNIVSSIGNKVSDAITPINEGTKTVLAKTSLPVLDKYISTGQAAISDFSKITPLELAGKEAENAVKTLTGQLKTIGTRKADITETIASKPVGDMALRAKDTIQKGLLERTGSTVTGKGAIKNASGRVSSITSSADASLLKEVNGSLAKLGENPTFREVDDTVDRLQQLLYERKGNLLVAQNSKVEAVIKGAIKELNSNLKTFATKAGAEDYVKYNDAYSRYISAYTKLNKVLGAEGDKGGALMKRVFSPSDAGTKKLFEEVKKLTNGKHDLVQEATLAKFVMENLGDARQASLLEEVMKSGVPTSGKSFVASAANKIISKLQDPIGKARKMTK